MKNYECKFETQFIDRVKRGVQESLIGNHCHPYVFCGMHAPQLIISNKKVNIKPLILGNNTILTSVNRPMVYNIVKAFFIAPQF